MWILPGVPVYWDGDAFGSLGGRLYVALPPGRAGTHATTRTATPVSQPLRDDRQERCRPGSLPDLHHLLAYEILVLAYVLLREPHLLLGYLEAVRLLPSMRRKRTVLQQRRRARGIGRLRLDKGIWPRRLEVELRRCRSGEQRAKPGRQRVALCHRCDPLLQPPAQASPHSRGFTRRSDHPPKSRDHRGGQCLRRWHGGDGEARISWRPPDCQEQQRGDRRLEQRLRAR